MNVRVTLQGSGIDVRRIFCIGRNYAAHAAELGNETPGEPVVFMKPPTAIVPPGERLVLPAHRGSVHHEAELVLLIGRDGAQGVADIAGITLGLDLTLRDEQMQLKAKGLPWELAKAFDGSAPLGEFTAMPEDLSSLEFECRVNGERRQHGHIGNMLFPPVRLLEFLASRFRLLRGDLVFTGTPAGVGPLSAGDRIEIGSPAIGDFYWQCEQETGSC